ncbi:SDR family oxidoreductase [Patescibacteria group bacterium AH-259-L07]|nr:SDR family oxidoreductase [Patescibacteria group bacterium AH-259-L07]
MKELGRSKNPMAKNSKKYTILVTGGAGFIGSNIAAKLLKDGEFVRIVDDFSTGKKENIKEFLDNPNFELLKGDISDLNVAKDAVKGTDFVLHQAAIPSVPRSVNNPLRSNKVNINGTLNILISARDEKIKKLVYASSSSVYGDSPQLPKKETFSPNPISPYALTKFAGEKYTQLFAVLYGLPTVCIRYFNVFGPKQDPTSQYSAVIPNFISAVLNDRSPTIYGDGNQSRDFTFVENVVEANVLALQSNASGELINIACGKRTTLNDLLKYINQILGKNIKPVYEKSRPGDIRHSLADISKAKKILGYEPKITIKQGLKKTIAWYRDIK